MSVVGWGEVKQITGQYGLGARYLFFEREMVARLLGIVNLKTLLILGSDDDGSAAYALSFDWPHTTSPVLQEEG